METTPNKPNSFSKTCDRLSKGNKFRESSIYCCCSRTVSKNDHTRVTYMVVAFISKTISTTTCVVKGSHELIVRSCTTSLCSSIYPVWRDKIKLMPATCQLDYILKGSDICNHMTSVLEYGADQAHAIGFGTSYIGSPMV
ncbi:hypothetical protein NPIL_663051 [Nephila pilipes]|uniref:Uncharacterized protein n=1 Tax=Nephila pilipes TaxID=299642 RepID=A0A8X6MN65_NEPPI|nr:hypothetical protein NPIL_663051 [Nephila pilipes]